MTSKELVPLEAGRGLAVIESPCPIFDRQVKTIVLEIDNLARNRDVFPTDRETEREHFEYSLRRLVNDVEAGKWAEPMPEPDGPVTEPLPKPVGAIEELTPEWVDEHWDAMMARDKWNWLVDRYVDK